MKMFIILIPLFLFTNCKSQIKSLAKLKNTTWHIGANRSGDTASQQPALNSFTDDLYINFQDSDSVQLSYHQYSPGIGNRITLLKGKYRLNPSKKEVAFILEEPEGYVASIGGKQVQYSLSVFKNLASKNIQQGIDVAGLPRIVSYSFVITDTTDTAGIITKLTLIDLRGARHSFGTFKFDNEMETDSNRSHR